MADNDLQVGDTVRLQFGPFAATGDVVGVDEHGARVLVKDNAQLVGYHYRQRAPDSTPLTEGPNETFIGRAHWASTEKITPTARVPRETSEEPR